MRFGILGASVIVVLAAGHAAAQPHDPAIFAGSYECNDIASTGFAYNEETNGWRQVSFYPETVAVDLDLIEAYEIENPYIAGKMEPNARYAMTLTTESGFESTCWSFSGEQVLTVNEYAWIRCRSLNNVWSLNLATGRFVRALTDGYAGEGETRYGSTPNVTLGQCTRVD